MFKYKRIINPAEKPPLGSILDPVHPLSQGLTGCWIFNEGGGNTVHNLAFPDIGSIVNGCVWDGDAIKTDGSTNYVRVLDPTGRYSKDNFTLLVTLTMVSSATVPMIIDKKQSLDWDDSKGWRFERWDASALTFVGGGSTVGDRLPCPTAWGERCTIAIKKAEGETTVYAYKNGKYTGSQVCNVVGLSTEAFDINYDQKYARYLESYIEKISYYDKVLSDLDILQLYAEPYINILTPQYWHMVDFGATAATIGNPWYYYAQQ